MKVQLPVREADSATGSSSRARRATWVGAWIYAFLIGSVWYVLWFTADRWSVGTLVMFAPHWPLALPLLVLVPAAYWHRRKALWVLGVAAVVLVEPILGVHVPWQTVFEGSRDERTLRVMTWNIHDSGADAEAFVKLIRDSKPDVIVLQSWSDRFEADFFGGDVWHLLRQDQFLVASRFEILSTKRIVGKAFADAPSGGAAHYVLDTSAGTVDLFNVHLASPRYGLTAATALDAEGLAAVDRDIAIRRAQSKTLSEAVDTAAGRLLIVGDFNLPPESAIYGDYWDKYEDAFSRGGWGIGNTFFFGWMGVRIDHVLAGHGWRCRRAWVGPDLGSDHRPVLADLEPLDD